jgi:FlaA1/EpsC-like NDP-sugar epimerase
MQGVDCVFHSAALKHVGICETSPEQAVMTNILGTQNLIDSAIQHRVSKFLFMSSDKAVNPTNVMGTSKLMAERIVIAGNLRDSDTKFSCTRFGNVLGSSGSVLPIFLKQIDSGGPITLTDKRMTRFIMTIRDAVMLVVKSMEQLVGGEIFITKMPVVKIADLATALIELKTQINVIQVTEVGASPGEKLYEELMTEQEMPWSVELDNFFMVKPMLGGIYQNIPEFDLDRKYPTCDRVYNSRNEIALTVLELKRYITSNDLLNAD